VFQLNVDFMRKMPPDAHACNVMVGEVSCLQYQVSSVNIHINTCYAMKVFLKGF